MRNIMLLVAVVMSLAFAGTVLADGPALYKTHCSPCHGTKGQGTKGMAPAHVGNEFLTKSPADVIKTLVRTGRAGADKKYKEFPIDMPKFDAAKISDGDLDELVNFEQGDLQKGGH